MIAFLLAASETIDYRSTALWCAAIIAFGIFLS